MKRFKNFLAEGMSTEVSTALETVLGKSYESVSLNNPKILKDAMANDKQFGKTTKYWKKMNGEPISPTQSLKNLQSLGEKIIASPAGPKKGGTFDFQSGGNLSQFWKDSGGSNNTAKADIILDGKQYSVKNADGAQLMSGKKGESKATALAAAEATASSSDAPANFAKSDVVKDLLASIDELKTVTTKGYSASADNLQRLKQNADEDTTLYMLAQSLTKEAKRYAKEEKIYKTKKGKLKGKTNEKALANLTKEWERAWPPNTKGKEKITTDGKGKSTFVFAKKEQGKTFAGWSKIGKLGAKGRPSLGREIPKVLKRGKPAIALQTKIDEENQKFTKYVDGKFKKNAGLVQTKLESLFKKDRFKREFCYEAASGKRKFEDGSVQVADHMLSWKPSEDGVQDFVVSTYVMKNYNAKIIKTYSGMMKTDVNWKSSSTTGHKGYNVYQNVRLGLGQIQEETNYVQDVLIEEYKQLTNSLQEGIINEAGFFSKLKDMSKKFISTIKEFGQRILNWFKEAIEKIKSAASEGVDALGSVLGFEMDVQTNADKEISIPI